MKPYTKICTWLIITAVALLLIDLLFFGILLGVIENRLPGNDDDDYHHQHKSYHDDDDDNVTPVPPAPAHLITTAAVVEADGKRLVLSGIESETQSSSAFAVSRHTLYASNVLVEEESVVKFEIYSNAQESEKAVMQLTKTFVDGVEFDSVTSIGQLDDGSGFFEDFNASLVKRGGNDDDDDDDDNGGGPPAPPDIPQCGVRIVRRREQGIHFFGKHPTRFVGINTKFPLAQLDVNGDALFRGDVKICGDLDLCGDVTLNNETVYANPVRECDANTQCAHLFPLNGCQLPVCLEYVADGGRIECLLKPNAATVGSSCDDGLVNTIGETCQRTGMCIGEPTGGGGGGSNGTIDECTLAQRATCTTVHSCQMLSGCFVDSVSGVSCVFEDDPASVGDSCDDHNPLTDNDVCDADGHCVGTPLDVLKPCTVNSCPANTPNACLENKCVTSALGDMCLAVLLADGTSCDDGDSQTTSDQCVGGVCRGAPVVTPAPTPLPPSGGSSRECNATELLECPFPRECRSRSCSVMDDGYVHCSDYGDPIFDGTSCEDDDPDTDFSQCFHGVCAGADNTPAPTTAPPTDAPTDSPTRFPTAQPTPQPTLAPARVCTMNETMTLCGTDPYQCQSWVCTIFSDSTFNCATAPDEEGMVCDDSDPNTLSSICVDGVCRGVITLPGEEVTPCTTPEEDACILAANECTFSTCKRLDGVAFCADAADRNQDAEACLFNNDVGIAASCFAGQCYRDPTPAPTQSPTVSPTVHPTQAPTVQPTLQPFANAVGCTPTETAANCPAPQDCRVPVCLRLADNTYYCADDADAAQDTNPCDDGRAETEDDRCFNGQCVGLQTQPPTDAPTDEPTRVPTPPPTLQPVSNSRMCIGGEAAICDALPQSQCHYYECIRLGGDLATKCLLQINSTANGDDCDDGRAETTDDKCFNGYCVGLQTPAPTQAPTNAPPTPQPTLQPTLPPARACSPIEAATLCLNGNVTLQCQEYTCTIFYDNTFTCGTVPISDGSSCDDQQPNTTPDVCVDGACVGNPISTGSVTACSAPEIAACDASTNECRVAQCQRLNGVPFCADRADVGANTDPCVYNEAPGASAECFNGQCYLVGTPSPTRAPTFEPTLQPTLAPPAPVPAPPGSRVCNSTEEGDCPAAAQCRRVYCAVLSDGNKQCADTPDYAATTCDDEDPLTFGDRCVQGVCLGFIPSDAPTLNPTPQPTNAGTTNMPTNAPTPLPTKAPTMQPTLQPVANAEQCSGPETIANCPPAADCREMRCLKLAGGAFYCADLADAANTGACDDGNPFTTDTRCVNGECVNFDTPQPTLAPTDQPTMPPTPPLVQTRMCTEAPDLAVCDALPQSPCRAYECILLGASDVVKCLLQVNASANNVDCDDNNPFTTDTRCFNGECVNYDTPQPTVAPTLFPTQAPSLPDAFPCVDALTTCGPVPQCREWACVAFSSGAPSQCSVRPATNTVPPTACDDGLANTSPDICVNGECVGNPLDSGANVTTCSGPETIECEQSTNQDCRYGNCLRLNGVPFCSDTANTTLNGETCTYATFPGADAQCTDGQCYLVATTSPTRSPTASPTKAPSPSPTTASPTTSPTVSPTQTPTPQPTLQAGSRLCNPTEELQCAPLPLGECRRYRCIILAEETSATCIDQPDFTLNGVNCTEETFGSAHAICTDGVCELVATPAPTNAPSASPTARPTDLPTVSPTRSPSVSPTASPTRVPTLQPTLQPSSRTCVPGEIALCEAEQRHPCQTFDCIILSDDTRVCIDKPDFTLNGNTTACSDGTAATQGDFCWNGECVGLPVKDTCSENVYDTITGSCGNGTCMAMLDQECACVCRSTLTGDAIAECPPPATASPTAAPTAGVENTVALCTDGIDNDGDLLIDCDDPDCCAVVPPCSINPACAKRKRNEKRQVDPCAQTFGAGFEASCACDTSDIPPTRACTLEEAQSCNFDDNTCFLEECFYSDAIGVHCSDRVAADGTGCSFTDQSTFSSISGVCEDGVCRSIGGVTRECVGIEQDNCVFPFNANSGEASTCRRYDCVHTELGEIICVDTAEPNSNGNSCQHGTFPSATAECYRGECYLTATNSPTPLPTELPTASPTAAVTDEPTASPLPPDARRCEPGEIVAECGAPPQCRDWVCTAFADDTYNCATRPTEFVNNTNCDDGLSSTFPDQCNQGECVGVPIAAAVNVTECSVAELQACDDDTSECRYGTCLKLNDVPQCSDAPDRTADFVQSCTHGTFPAAAATCFAGECFLDATASPTRSPTVSPTAAPSVSPSVSPTAAPSVSPSASPTRAPTLSPTLNPTASPLPPDAQPCPNATAECGAQAQCRDWVCILYGSGTTQCATTTFNVPQGSSCDDGTLTTINDTCVQGECVGEVPPEDITVTSCSGPEIADCDAQSNECRFGTCVRVNGIAQCSDAPDRLQDNALCNYTEAIGAEARCWAGQCFLVATDAPTNLPTQAPTSQPTPLPTPCPFDTQNDPLNCGTCGNVCDQGAACAGGQCQASRNCTQVELEANCGASTPQCLQRTCTRRADLTFACGTQPANEGLNCTDGNELTTDDVCVEGACLGTSRVSRVCTPSEEVLYNCNTNAPAQCRETNCFILDDNSPHCKDGPDYALNGNACDDDDPDTVASICMNGDCRALDPSPCADAAFVNSIDYCGLDQSCGCLQESPFCYANSPCAREDCVVIDENNVDLFTSSLDPEIVEWKDAFPPCVLWNVNAGIANQYEFDASNVVTGICFAVQEGSNLRGILTGGGSDVIVVADDLLDDQEPFVFSHAGNDLIILSNTNIARTDSGNGDDTIHACKLDISFLFGSTYVRSGNNDDCVIVADTLNNLPEVTDSGGANDSLYLIGGATGPSVTISFPSLVTGFEEWIETCENTSPCDVAVPTSSQVLAPPCSVDCNCAPSATACFVGSPCEGIESQHCLQISGRSLSPVNLNALPSNLRCVHVLGGAVLGGINAAGVSSSLCIINEGSLTGSVELGTGNDTLACISGNMNTIVTNDGEDVVFLASCSIEADSTVQTGDSDDAVDVCLTTVETSNTFLIALGNGEDCVSVQDSETIDEINGGAGDTDKCEQVNSAPMTYTGCEFLSTPSCASDTPAQLVSTPDCTNDECPCSIPEPSAVANCNLTTCFTIESGETVINNVVVLSLEQSCIFVKNGATLQGSIQIATEIGPTICVLNEGVITGGVSIVNTALPGSAVTRTGYFYIQNNGSMGNIQGFQTAMFVRIRSGTIGSVSRSDGPDLFRLEACESNMDNLSGSGTIAASSSLCVRLKNMISVGDIEQPSNSVIPVGSVHVQSDNGTAFPAVLSGFQTWASCRNENPCNGDYGSISDRRVLTCTNLCNCIPNDELCNLDSSCNTDTCVVVGGTIAGSSFDPKTLPANVECFHVLNSAEIVTAPTPAPSAAGRLDFRDTRSWCFINEGQVGPKLAQEDGDNRIYHPIRNNSMTYIGGGSASFGWLDSSSSIDGTVIISGAEMYPRNNSDDRAIFSGNGNDRVDICDLDINASPNGWRIDLRDGDDCLSIESSNVGSAATNSIVLLDTGTDSFSEVGNSALIQTVNGDDLAVPCVGVADFELCTAGSEPFNFFTPTICSTGCSCVNDQKLCAPASPCQSSQCVFLSSNTGSFDLVAQNTDCVVVLDGVTVSGDVDASASNTSVCIVIEGVVTGSVLGSVHEDVIFTRGATMQDLSTGDGGDLLIMKDSSVLSGQATLGNGENTMQACESSTSNVFFGTNNIGTETCAKFSNMQQLAFVQRAGGSGTGLVHVKSSISTSEFPRIVTGFSQWDFCGQDNNPCPLNLQCRPSSQCILTPSICDNSNARCNKPECIVIAGFVQGRFNLPSFPSNIQCVHLTVTGRMSTAGFNSGNPLASFAVAREMCIVVEGIIGPSAFDSGGAGSIFAPQAANDGSLIVMKGSSARTGWWEELGDSSPNWYLFAGGQVIPRNGGSNSIIRAGSDSNLIEMCEVRIVLQSSAFSATIQGGLDNDCISTQSINAFPISNPSFFIDAEGGSDTCNVNPTGQFTKISCEFGT